MYIYARTLAFHLNSAHVVERVLTSDLKIHIMHMMLGGFTRVETMEHYLI